ncbi:hypothetical protein B9T33_01220 [Acinetobacter sp. ANC 5054]|uniref:DUF805 domain-containing protein n=1 Tax=Acinetobacter sp. ANC 5054 TaxID=1977877 RepID=UPI000A3596B2|nr:DUF805 domain-containing protein [Acinetobacter sp. ANC 5054]OTG84439.1 hypothetical protein B9T33_01220 [Acinetobacter sp. ANC 5054]
MNNTTQIDSGWNRDGRFNRMSFVGWNVFYGLMMTILMLMLLIMMPNTFNAIIENAESPTTQVVLFIINIIILIPALIFSVRRLHDFNVSGWFALLELIPLLNILMFLALMLIPSSETSNKYGEPRASKTWEVVLAFLFFGLLLLILVNLLFAARYIF